ncbi:TetR/AcrR family transcriptional regulator [bacterium]|jgi:AcrR family transcriptional regulator|nr:TetR/AcrR family transcriptional regulator [bacterium]
MRSAETTREQLLKLAVEMFAEKGFADTSLRAIAKRAEVSPALLIHHFGTKDALVKEAISKTLGSWVAGEKAMMLEDESNQLQNWQTLMEKGTTPLNFFRQVLLAEGEYSQRLFDAAVSESEVLLNQMQSVGRLREISDKQTTALIMAVNGLGSVLLMSQIEKSMGGPISSDHVATRLMNSNSEMLRDGIFKPANTTNEKAGK